MLVGAPCPRNANHGNVQMSASDQVVKGGENLLVSKIAHGSEEHKGVGLFRITEGSTRLSQVRHRSPCGQAKSPSSGQSRTSRLRIHRMGCGKWLSRIPEMLTIAARAALADLNEAYFTSLLLPTACLQRPLAPGDSSSVLLSRHYPD